MFISSASLDDNQTYLEHEYGADELTRSLVIDLVKSLDGSRYTLVTISPGGEAHMAIGGDARHSMVVYATTDNLIFHNLLTGILRPKGIVSLVAGGQPGDYDSRKVVTLDEALTAAVCYAESGELASELSWEVQ